ncbi:MAG: SDR family NAD(P)-dependent oxidoreductase [Acidobacteriota bacterium]
MEPRLFSSPQPPPRSTAARLRASMWRQRSRSLSCPEVPRLEGRLALVTGGSRGIGLETTRGLRARGAEVISASRSASPEAERELGMRHQSLDLSDLGSVKGAVAELSEGLQGQSVDLLVANAGLWPTAYRASAQGHEIAFATNVLGHHALIRGLQRSGALAPDATVVVVTGDIYVLARDCTPDYRYRTPLGGQWAYCRSKLGNHWQAQELARRDPQLTVRVVHPGVVASELSGSSRGPVGAVKRSLMLSLAQGAQATLYAATQPDLPSGAYLHNTLGWLQLEAGDAAADEERAQRFWRLLEELLEELGEPVS